MPLFPPIPEVSVGEDVAESWGDQVARGLNILEAEVSKLIAAPSVPIGGVIMFGGDVAPTKYMICRGQEVSRATSPELFAAIGTKFGAGNGTTTFNLPNFQGLIPVGFNSGANPPPGTTNQFNAGVGERAGAYDSAVVAHQHSMENHYHDMSNHVHGGVDHMHRIYADTGGYSNSHVHTPISRTHFIEQNEGGPHALQINPPGQPPVAFVGTDTSTNWASDNHTHRLDGYAGGADRSLTVGPSSPNTTSWATGHNTNWAGVGATNTNIQPSLSMNFIVRVA